MLGYGLSDKISDDIIESMKIGQKRVDLLNFLYNSNLDLTKFDENRYLLEIRSIYRCPLNFGAICPDYKLLSEWKQSLLKIPFPPTTPLYSKQPPQTCVFCKFYHKIDRVFEFCAKKHHIMRYKKLLIKYLKTQL